MSGPSSRLTAPLLTLVAAVAMAPTGASAITRDVIMSRAQAYADEAWTCTSANTKVSCTSGWSSDYAPGSYKGLPYDWGGYVELSEFQEQLSKGYGAGSHSKHGVLSCTTGVDCSGYVSKCWKAGHYSTSTMHNIAHEITKEAMKKGDAWNDAGSHIVLWAGAAGDGAPLFYEASGSAKKVRLNTGASWSYLVGYKPMRYDYVEEGPSGPVPGSKAQPVIIGAFPFHHEYSTLATESSEWSTYSCMPQSGAEGGPEVLYRFDLAQPGLFEAHVSDGSGVDVDLQLLGAYDPFVCLERHDTDIGPVLLEPGTWWLVADSWSNASGQSFPGAYVLDADFEATGPVPDPPDQEQPPVEEPDAGSPPVTEPDAGGAPVGEPDAGATPIGEPDAGGSVEPPAAVDAGTHPSQDATVTWAGDAAAWEPDPAEPGGGGFAAPGDQPTLGSPSKGQTTALAAPGGDGGCGAADGGAGPLGALALALWALVQRRRARTS